MTPWWRRFTFTTHVTSSIGWVGAAITFLALAAIGLMSQDERTVRVAYLVTAPAAWFVLVPLAHASLLSGVALSLGTTWGLFRHYWVVVKLAITVFCAVILMIYMGTFRQMAGIAADPLVDVEHVRNASPMLHAVLALMPLLTATVLAVYKPLGMTPYGRRRQERDRQGFASGTLSDSIAVDAVTNDSARGWIYLLGIFVVGLLVLVAILHLASGGLDHH